MEPRLYVRTSGMSEETSTQTAVASVFTETGAENHQVQTPAKCTSINLDRFFNNTSINLLPLSLAFCCYQQVYDISFLSCHVILQERVCDGLSSRHVYIAA